MFWRPKPQVLVSGAGPVGLFAALSLARRGIRVRIIDEEWRGTTHSYALALHPRSLELLDEFDLARAVLSKARDVHAVSFYDGAGRQAQMSLGGLTTKFPLVAVLAQSDFEDLLVQALEARDVEVEWNHRLARFHQASDHVDATVETLGSESVGYVIAGSETVVESSRDIQVPFLIGADGHDSLVRTQMGIEFLPVRPSDDFAVFEFDAEGELPDEMCVVIDNHYTNVLWPMSGNRCRWSFQVDDRAPESSRDKDRLLMPLGARAHAEVEAGRLSELIAERAPWFDAEIGKVHWSKGVRFEYRLASTFGGQRVHLVGDAVHMTGPVGVQSMNLGLAESAELTTILAGILIGTQSVDALAMHSARRMGEWRRLLGVGAPGLSATDKALPWTRQHADQLTACIPASGEHYTKLAAQVGLDPRPM